MTLEHVVGMRRAAAMWTHWGRDDVDGVVEVLAELPDKLSSEAMGVVCGLLNLGRHMVSAARQGHDQAYLAEVLALAAADEVEGDVLEGWLDA